LEDTLRWTSSSGRIELKLSKIQIQQGYHPGPCDLDIAELKTQPNIHWQLDQIPKDTLVEGLGDYGAWTRHDLSDHGANLLVPE